MSVERIGVFLLVRNGRTQAPEYRFFNSMVRGDDGQPLTVCSTNLIEGVEVPYYYIPFIYAGGQANRVGDNLSASLQLAPNEVSMSFATDMVEMIDRNTDAERLPMTVEACVVSLHPTTWEPVSVITREIWVAAGMTYTTEVIEIVLSSAIDAVNALAPSYSLNRTNVGRLPSTSSVRF